jgi:NAD(P)-dependent dehydrogenase (short-subunit alcohol dehydrogenase family)
MQLTILTGASRGLGLAMARQLLAQDHQVLAISRAGMGFEHPMLESWQQDLAQAEAAASRLQAWLAQRQHAGLSGVTLINNAAMLPQIAPLSALSAADIRTAVAVGLEAPMQLTRVFLAATEGWACPRRVLNISSGLGRRAMASQAPYCTVKAGLDHFSRSVALDEALLQERGLRGAKVCSLAPGVIDTDMQVQLRGADASAFPDQPAFAAMKEQGRLWSADEAAAKVLAYLARPDFGANPVADVRDA